MTLLVRNQIHQRKTVMMRDIVDDGTSVRIFPYSADKRRKLILITLKEAAGIHKKTIVMLSQIPESRCFFSSVNILRIKPLARKRFMEASPIR